MSEQSFDAVRRVLGLVLLFGLSLCALTLMMAFAYWVLTGGVARMIRYMNGDS